MIATPHLIHVYIERERLSYRPATIAVDGSALSVVARTVVVSACNLMLGPLAGWRK